MYLSKFVLNRSERNLFFEFASDEPSMVHRVKNTGQFYFGEGATVFLLDDVIQGASIFFPLLSSGKKVCKNHDRWT